ncbi:FGGY-family carbohydrate kinase [Sulfitobacter geojensis]|uniref:FGGY-family carbohydrate kinase n=1 Tax=Sulfitobacter geojensis TaxID=1342299 RepID=UPI0004683A4D|nr:FGGY-family carbohydrate kinase [Sulfitobacter geojensis]KHA54199.1 Rhamnulokinase RhaK [Sulfitobacter geojensis]NYI30025.1 sugar (pentulose or hexulose) kinase [Sulfitobacter geojensis]
MTEPQHIAVIDIGKTNAKLALVDLATLTEIAVVTRPNVVQAESPWPHYDVEGHWAFLLGALRTFHRDHRVNAISITTHGACAALLAADGSLAAPILDYEYEYPSDIVTAYDALKPDFALTGSPRMVGGLNIGAQLHYQFTTDPTLRDRTAQIVTYPQFWGHRLTGIAATDVTSLGCHTDLWDPHKGAFSNLAAALGVQDEMATVRHPSDILGPILPDIAEATGLDPNTPVCVGIHDSNASLYPHLLSQHAPACVVSTGTWVVAMSLTGNDAVPIPPLDPARDTLINVNALGQAVPSARFMGGREYEVIQNGHPYAPTRQDVTTVLERSLMLLPSVEHGTGPFQGCKMQWRDTEPPVGSGQRSVALSYYLALMTGTCLDLIEGTGPTIVEGPFAHNAEFIAMLKAVTHRPVFTSEAVTGTSIGAALLFNHHEKLPNASSAENPHVGEDLLNYVDRWRTLVQTGR